MVSRGLRDVVLRSVETFRTLRDLGELALVAEIDRRISQRIAGTRVALYRDAVKLPDRLLPCVVDLEIEPGRHLPEEFEQLVEPEGLPQTIPVRIVLWRVANRQAAAAPRL